MTFWLDAQLSPYLSDWISDHFDVSCRSLRELDLRDANDNTIFEKAYKQDAIVITKDSDFVHLSDQKANSPRILWITLGNTSNQRMREVLNDTFNQVITWFEEGEMLIEITGESDVERRI